MTRLVTDAPVTLTGYIRFPEKAGMLTPPENLDEAAVVHAGSSGDGARARLGPGREMVAPFYIDLETPVPASGIPKPGPLEVHLKDDHMQYAITWFGLAGAVVIAFGVWWRATAAGFVIPAASCRSGEMTARVARAATKSHIRLQK